MKQYSIGKYGAIKLAETEWYKYLPPELVALAQLKIAELAMPFDDFQTNVEKALDRSVFTHEFAEPEKLLAELCLKEYFKL